MKVMVVKLTETTSWLRKPLTPPDSYCIEKPVPFFT